MAQNIGTLITAAIRPNDSLDLIASAFQNEIKGGLHSYSATTERNALISARRQEGMLVYVADVQKYYKLNSGLTNSDWVEFTVGGSGSATTISTDYTTFKSLSGSFLTNQVYDVADSTDVFGYGSDYALRLQTLGPVDSFISGVELSGVNSTNRLIQINLNNDYITYLEDNYSKKFLNKQIESLPVVISTVLNSGQTITIDNNQQTMVYGNFTNNGGDIIISGSGEFIVFDTETPSGGTVSAGSNIDVAGVTVSLKNDVSINTLTANTVTINQFLNMPAYTTDVFGSAGENDTWFLFSAGTITLTHKRGGLAYTVELTN